MSDRPTIAYQPALDGVRAFAVIAVLLFHGGVPGFSGGYLGVSVFFTLSGFLITSLLLHEHRATGTIDLAAFYGRRLRRLLPASVLVLLGVVALSAFTDLFDGVASLRSHVLGSVFQVANWVFLAGDGSYQDLLARTSGSSSPLEHFWSLAIEEQFYWVWPPFLMLVLAKVPSDRGRLFAVGAVAALTAIAAPVTAVVWGPDAAYWATPARLSEIVIGALLAVLIAGRSVPDRWAALAPAALAILVACILLFPSSGGPAYAGWLPAIGVASSLLIVGLQVRSPVRTVLEHDVVVWVGKVSYGLYLFHWPVFVLIHPDRFSWPGPVLFLVRIVVTLGITIASYELFEQPIRTRRSLGPRPTFIGAATATAAVAIVAVVGVSGSIGEYWNPDDDVVEAASIDVSDTPLETLVPERAPATSSPPSIEDDQPDVPSSSVATVPSAETTVAPADVDDTADIDAFAVAELPPIPELPRPVRIIVTGDSTAEAFGTGLVNWAAEHPELAQVEIVSAPGCGFLDGGERRTGDTIAPIEGCDGWIEGFVYPAVERLQPDVVVAMVTSWDIIDRRWEAEAMLTPLDGDFAARLESDYSTYTDRLGELGAAHVALVRHPIPDVYWLPAADAQEDPERHAVVYDLYDRLAGADDSVSVIALDRWLQANDLDRSETVRPDGIHPTPEAATDISERFLGDQLVRIALELPRP